MDYLRLQFRIRTYTSNNFRIYGHSSSWVVQLASEWFLMPKRSKPEQRGILILWDLFVNGHITP